MASHYGALEQSKETDSAGSPDHIRRVLVEFLTRHPDARVGAVTADAAIRLVGLPPDLGLPDGYARIEGPSLSGLVVEADQAVITRIWWRARRSGVAGATVRLKFPEERAATVSIFDLQRSHNVLAVAVVDHPISAEELHGLAAEGEFPARFSRVTKDGNARLLDVDPALERLLGWAGEDLIGTRSLELIHPDDHDTAIEHWVQMCEFPGPSRPVRLRHRHRDGRWIWVEVTNHNRLADPEYRCVVADMVDVTEEVAAYDALRARQQLLEQITETVPIGLLHADHSGRLLYVNPRLTEVTGLRTGMQLADCPLVVDADSQQALAAALERALGGTTADTIIELRSPQRETRHCSLSLRPLHDEAGSLSGVTGAVEDISAHLAERRELELRAATDDLTGCLNRGAALAVVQDALDALPPVSPDDHRAVGVAVIYVDVDNLKNVNDSLGHSAGDLLLAEVAHRLRNAVRARDAVGRLGGDEFVVAAAHVSSRDHAMALARWIASRITRPFEGDDRRIDIKASFGVAWTAAAGVSAEAMLAEADAAMYVSKRNGNCEPVIAG